MYQLRYSAPSMIVILNLMNQYAIQSTLKCVQTAWVPNTDPSLHHTPRQQPSRWQSAAAEAASRRRTWRRCKCQSTKKDSMVGWLKFHISFTCLAIWLTSVAHKFHLSFAILGPKNLGFWTSASGIPRAARPKGIMAPKDSISVSIHIPNHANIDG